MPDPKLEIRRAGAKGRGVFALEPIGKGQRVLALEGRILRSEDLTDDMLALQVGPDLWLCSLGSLLDDFVNHSCEPNTGFTTGETILYALRNIEAGEEVCWDYSTSISEAGWSLDCCCGSPSCREVVRPWGELTANERDRLRGIALRYLRTK
ncbi:MAG TPA: SET domain-containing protein [Gemmataceae bacterium]|jgi:SET domain-containing protein|nr:SET domain-containing protein [Gemmataceae bacterium]